MHQSLGSSNTSVEDLLSTLAALLKRRAEVDQMIALLESLESGLPGAIAGAWPNTYPH